MPDTPEARARQNIDRLLQSGSIPPTEINFGISVAANAASRMHGEHQMGKYQKGDHVKIEVTNEQSGEREWMWLLVDNSNDKRQLVFGQLV